MSDVRFRNLSAVFIFAYFRSRFVIHWSGYVPLILVFSYHVFRVTLLHLHSFLPANLARVRILSNLIARFVTALLISSF